MTAVLVAPNRPRPALRIVASSSAPLQPSPADDPMADGRAFARTLPVSAGRPDLVVVAPPRSIMARYRLAGRQGWVRSVVGVLPAASALAVVAMLITSVAALVLITSTTEIPVRPQPAPASALVARPGPSTPADDGAGQAPEVERIASSRYVVRPGDTLWGIARSLRPQGDVRPLVDELSRRLDGQPLQPGMSLALDGLVQP